MSHIAEGFDWSVTTREGARRENLRRWCALTLRERLQALEDMGDLAEHFRWMRETGRFTSARPRQDAPSGDKTPAVSQSPAQHQSDVTGDEEASPREKGRG